MLVWKAVLIACFSFFLVMFLVSSSLGFSYFMSFMICSVVGFQAWPLGFCSVLSNSLLFVLLRPVTWLFSFVFGYARCLGDLFQCIGLLLVLTLAL